MMNAQECWSLYEGPSHLGRHGGTLRVEAGQVWMTRSGDPDDHFLRAGDAIRVPRGDVLVEACDAAETPARIVWEPGGWFERWRSRVRTTCAQCWELADRPRRLVLGSLAAAAALLVLGLVFGPLSSGRALALAEAHASAAGLHNAGQPRRPDGRPQAGERPRFAAEKARRGAAGAA
jgi:hypothetical protein